ncbi:Repeat domain-containing protein [Aquiflexum balticum DSM 16537]|uniref:Repeat domain-containing protein n=1 Tax=Aquiflexum balticum DSM 16537 TaxID=758820 RepID=A0A1W2H4U2_9BACT|nr:VCBS repeat-containing protein [Aquiflexum balticum]SMD43899.1 Repeat domain-containing protein [Aquiflexum balticum DSM 16537]
MKVLFLALLILIPINVFNYDPFKETRDVPIFESLSARKTGIRFQNTLSEGQGNNILTYEYFYNGGGVAVGDINNDGLDDIYFTGNMVPNKLYLNEGDFKFKDITKEAGVEGRKSWTTGVTMADVNSDGWLDIYVCFSGKGSPDTRRNQLFINQKNGTFTEEAAAYGLDDPSNSIQALFFDYDLDGDLDMYLLNHNTKVINEIEFDQARQDRNPDAGDKLFRNDNGKFVDVSSQAGIMGNSMGFGLGIAVSDISGNGYPDIHISNDYIEPDYLYFNNGDGTFTEKLTDHLQHISYFSMGSDISDVNNDGLPDIYTLDMLPEDNKRQKLLYGPENYEQYALMVMKGFYHQNMRNMLHLNNGNGTFSEIGQLAGISNTDWSWATFFVDVDNDGWKDLFVSNGYYRDYTNRDFLKFKGDYYFNKARDKETADTLFLVTSMSSTPVHNYLFKNNGDLTFTDKSNDWGFSQPNFSNGAAYADLDNDGNIDLVVNNLNAPAGIFRNQLSSDTETAGFLQLDLKGEGQNTFGYGAKISAYTKGKVQFFEQQPTRGFQSSVSHRVHFGIGNNQKVDSLTVVWQSGKTEKIYDIPANQVMIVEEKNASLSNFKNSPDLKPIFTKIQSPVDFKHQEYGYNDFKRQPLLLHMLTTCGPVMAIGDVDNNGLNDVFAGGTKGSPGKLFNQVSVGEFKESKGLDLSEDEGYTDADAVFFDATGDGNLDLYLASGGFHDYISTDENLQDRLYINQGDGKFVKSEDGLPRITSSASRVKPIDFDGDGLVDLFIGSRVIPGQFPKSPKSILLKNTGGGRFVDVIAETIPELEFGGMITDAVWTDLDGDGRPDLIVVGEYMPIRIFLNKEGRKFEEATSRFFDSPINGLWSTIAMADFDGDGDMDFIVGNFGLNSQLKASKQEPLRMTYADFDGNSSIDPILTQYIKGVEYPFASRDELLDQMYGLRSKFTNYESYSEAKLNDIFTKDQLSKASVLTADELRSVYLENKGGSFVVHSLPMQAQFTPIYAISVLDFDQDGKLDFILAGNQNSSRLRIGVMDSNFGQLFKGDGAGGFEFVSQKDSGLNFMGDVKSLQIMNVGNDKMLFIGVNNIGLEAYVLNKPK